MAANTAASAAATAEGDELDIRQLQGKQDKIRDLMRRDPRFIGRLIVVDDGAAVLHRAASWRAAMLSARLLSQC
jgi:hypothetical protein